MPINLLNCRQVLLGKLILTSSETWHPMFLRFKPDQLNNLPVDVMGEFSHKDVGFLRPEAMAGFVKAVQGAAAGCNEGFKPEQFEVLPPKVFEAMRLKQFEKLPPNVFEGFKPDQLNNLPVDVMVETFHIRMLDSCVQRQWLDLIQSSSRCCRLQ